MGPFWISGAPQSHRTCDSDPVAAVQESLDVSHGDPLSNRDEETITQRMPRSNPTVSTWVEILCTQKHATAGPTVKPEPPGGRRRDVCA